MDNLESVFPELANDSYRLDSDIELGNNLTLVAAYINAASYQFLKMLAEFDRRKCWANDGARCCSQWLNWKCGISRSAARDKLRMAHCLEKLPEINKAFAKGDLSYSKVRAMTRIATDDNEKYLLV